MAKSLRFLVAFLLFSLTWSLGLSHAQTKTQAPSITVYQDPG